MTAQVESASIPESTTADAEPPSGLMRRRLEALLGVPATEGNRLTVLHNGEEIFPAMLGAINAAQRSIDLMTFVYWKGDIATEFACTLARRAREGLRVRVLIDALGGRLVNDELVEEMKAGGVELQWFRKPGLTTIVDGITRQTRRGHRKVLICDETTAFTGGVGIAEEWDGDGRHEGSWRDTHIRVEGPAVAGLRAAFVQNWGESGSGLYNDHDTFPDQPAVGDSTVQVVRSSATYGWGDMATLFELLLRSARDRVFVTTAYFNPDDHFLRLLCDAADRGVDVRVLVPGPHADKRACQLAGESTYADLVDCGVQVWHYRPSMLHAKVILVDGAAAIVGSSNFNQRSLRLDEEVVLAILDESVVAGLERDFSADLEHSERIEPDRWEHRPVWQRAGEVAVGVLRRWF